MVSDVRQLRSERGLSQANLARELDVSRQTINSIENHRCTPPLRTCFSTLS